MKTEEEQKVEVKEIEALEEAPEVIKGIKKGNKIAGIVIAVFFVLTLAGLGTKLWLGREEVEKLSVGEGVSYVGKNEARVLEEYALNNFKFQELAIYKFREMTSEEIVEALGELKEGFSRVSKMVGQLELKPEFREMGEIVASDTAQFLTEIRNLRAIETREGVSEADKQVEFIKIVEEKRHGFRSAVYLSRYVFKGDEGQLLTKSGVAAEGKILVEVGGGVMNVFVGDYDEGAIGVSSEDYEGEVRTLKGEHELLVTTTGEMVEVGTGVKDEMEPGKGIGVRVECGEKGCEQGLMVEKRKIGMVGKTVFEVGEEFLGTGVKNFVKKGEPSGGAEAISEAILKIEKSRA